MILGELHSRLATLKVTPPQIKELEISKMLRQSFMTEVFGEDIMEEYILAHGPFQEHVYQKGTLISKKGSQNHYFYLVVRGSVSERVSSDEIVSH